MPVDHIARRIREVARTLDAADALLVTAGAGMSVDSGLPDYRGNHGFWRAYPPLAQLSISFERMAQPHWFIENPRMAWAWYGHRAQLYREATPHAGYSMLRKWIMSMRAGGFVVTSNVDGHFEEAVWGDRAIHEVHGNIHRLQCVTPCREEVWTAPLPDLQIDLETLTAEGELPRCPACGALARPNVLMFNDSHWVDGVSRDQGRRFDAWLARVRERRLVILELGAGKALPTIRRLGERIAQRSLTTLVRINPDAREETDTLISLPMGALEAIQSIRDARQTRKRTAMVAAPVMSVPGRAAEWRPAPTARSFEGPAASRAPSLTAVDLDTGFVSKMHVGDISEADQQSCFAAMYEGSGEAWWPVPAIAAHAPCGYRMNAWESDGALLIRFLSPQNTIVLQVVVGRRAAQATVYWKWLYETAQSRLAPLEQPRVPWIARQLGPGADKHRAMIGELMEVARVAAVVWLAEEGEDRGD